MAESSGSSTPNAVGKCAGIVFTVARCEAHPQNMKRAMTELIRARHRHPLRGTMLDECMLGGAIRSISFALWPDVMEDYCRYGETEENANDAIADFIEIRVRRIPLKNANEKSEGDL